MYIYLLSNEGKKTWCKVSLPDPQHIFQFCTALLYYPPVHHTIVNYTGYLASHKTKRWETSMAYFRVLTQRTYENHEELQSE
jgi:hypothetical protein